MREKKQVIFIIKKLLSNKQLNVFVLCFILSFALWVSITYSKEYVYNESFPISFVDSSNKVKFFTKDSVITLEIRTNGFTYIANRLYSSNKKKIIIDVNELNLDLSKGKVSISANRLKPLIIRELGYEVFTTKLNFENIVLNWKNVYSKRVPIVNRAKFRFVKPFNQYSKEELLTKYALIEGDRKDLAKIDTLYTKPITFENINKDVVLYVPVEVSNLSNRLVCKTTTIPIKIDVEKYTENLISVPVSVVGYDNYRNIKLLPQEVKLRYRVAMKDYKKVYTKDFKAYVVCSEREIEKNSKLKIFLSSVPGYVDVVNIIPDRVDYILFK